jgi:hypothetical protein
MKRFLLTLLGLGLIGSAFAGDEIRLPERPNRPAYKSYMTEDTGFWNAIELNGGTSLRFNHRNIQDVEVMYTAGYRFNEFLRVGVGVALRDYVNNTEVRGTDIDWACPIFVNARGNIISQESRTAVPFWSVNVGGVVRDGFYFSPTIGYRFGQLRNSFLAGVSYDLEQLYVAPGERSAENFVMLKLGYEF